MFGDSFFTTIEKLLDDALDSFRPHVWGFFFHSREHHDGISRCSASVFVPMFGDSFFTNGRYPAVHLSRPGNVFVPMFGDSFFTKFLKENGMMRIRHSFRPHVWGFFFHKLLHHQKRIKLFDVFVPMFGDSFFTAGLGGPTGWALYGPFAAGISN